MDEKATKKPRAPAAPKKTIPSTNMSKFVAEHERHEDDSDRYRMQSRDAPRE